jgi:hypothetical protein
MSSATTLIWAISVSCGSVAHRADDSTRRSRCPSGLVAYDPGVADENIDEPSARETTAPEVLVKSRQRVADHGEVFTPSWLVDDMLDLVKEESERIDARVLEPACGSGNFVVAVLRRKLASVETKFGASDFERRHHALLALMCIYGIELLEDNAAECRANLLRVLLSFLGADVGDEWHRAAQVVVDANIVHGDALDMTTASGEHVSFPEWGYLGKGKFQRRDFHYGSLIALSSFGSDTLFGDPGQHEIFTPFRTYPPMTVKEIAQ